MEVMTNNALARAMPKLGLVESYELLSRKVKFRRLH